MNTRLQVEHPVTEEAYDIDLVKNQIMVAAGYKVDFDKLEINNHTIECRINAENAKDFSPSPGTIKFINLPGGRGVRGPDRAAARGGGRGARGGLHQRAACAAGLQPGQPRRTPFVLGQTPST